MSVCWWGRMRVFHCRCIQIYNLLLHVSDSVVLITKCPLVYSIYLVRRVITLQLDSYAVKMQANTLTRHFKRVKSSAIECRKKENNGKTFVRTYVTMLIHLYIFINYWLIDSYWYVIAIRIISLYKRLARARRRRHGTRRNLRRKEKIMFLRRHFIHALTSEYFGGCDSSIPQFPSIMPASNTQLKTQPSLQQLWV